MMFTQAVREKRLQLLHSPAHGDADCVELLLQVHLHQRRPAWRWRLQLEFFQARVLPARSSSNAATTSTRTARCRPTRCASSCVGCIRASFAFRACGLRRMHSILLVRRRMHRQKKMRVRFSSAVGTVARLCCLPLCSGPSMIWSSPTPPPSRPPLTTTDHRHQFEEDDPGAVPRQPALPEVLLRRLVRAGALELHLPV
jgi:hypothetical protein